MTKEELISRTAKGAKLSKAAAARAINSTFDAIAQELKRGGRLILPGFGTFSVGYRKARTGRNPRTGQRMSIPAKKTPKFKAGKTLRQSVR
jgi:DNA-binding protein HU-beta